MLKMLKRGSGVRFENVMLDFEQGMMKALRQVFPGIQLRGCRFHLAQNWWRAIQRYGLATRYKNTKSAISKWLNKCFALPCLDEDLIRENFADLAASAPLACMPFVDYLDRWYMKSTSPFPPLMWASLSTRETPATNNGMEAFHRAFNDLVPSPHPNIRIFMDKLDVQSCKATIYSNPAPKPRKIKLGPLNFKDMHQLVRENKLDVSDFLSKVRAIEKKQKCKKRRKQPCNKKPRRK